MLSITQLYRALAQEIGPSGWWPADSKLEIMLGALLVQNTNWRNVARSLQNLKAATAFQADALLALDQAQLTELIRPSGFYHNKAIAIRTVATWFAQYQWDYTQIATHFGTTLRSELLTLRGVGQETADVFLVFIFDQPAFIADHYARLLFQQLGYANTQTYAGLQRQIQLPANFTFQDAQEFHGLIDEFGKQFLQHSGDFSRSQLAQQL